MTDTQWSDALLDEELAALYMSPATFKEISAGADLLTDLGVEETKFLFEAALQHGEYLIYWFNRLEAAGHGSAAWQIIDEKIVNEAARFEQAENAVKLLGEIRNAQALEYLKKALQQDALAPTVVRVLATMRTKDALAVLEEELHHERLADLVIDSLSQLRSQEAVDLIGLALRQKILAPHPEMALNRISKSRTHPSAKQAAEILKRWREEQADVETSLPKRVISTSEGPALKDRDWEILIRRIRDGRCTPLLGPDTSSKYFPSLASIAHQWATEQDYPFENKTDLPSVAEYLAVQYDDDFAKRSLQNVYQEAPQPELSDPNDTISLLADLPLSVYITTTYDDLLVRELRKRGREPKQEICRWHRSLSEEPSIFADGFAPSVANPVVFHFYGHVAIPASLVLTTRDHFNFLINVSRDPQLIPPRIEKALTGSTLLFLGFSFAELSTRVLFSFVHYYWRFSLAKTHVAVLRATSEDLALGEQQTRVQEYLDKYFESDTKIDRRTIDGFSAELRQRWQEISS